MALRAYRQLLRSSWIAFQGDEVTLRAARTEIHDRFRQNRNLEQAQAQIEIQQALEVAKILKENIVQGKQVSSEREGGDADLYKLRIHEHTERGDNDTIKMPNGQKVKIDGKKCSER